MEGGEAVLSYVVGWLRLAIELTSAVIIGFGVFSSVYQTLRQHLATGAKVYREARVRVAHFLVLGLELQLASDVLGTAIAPSWEQIGQLAAIAAIRTFLNYFLQRDQKEMEASMGENTESVGSRGKESLHS